LNVNVYVFIKHKAGNAIKECIMKSTSKLKAIRKIAGIIALVAIIGFSMTACNNGSSGGGGTNTGDGGGGGGSGKVPAALQGNWLDDDTGSGTRYLVFTKDGWGNGGSFSDVIIYWIVTSATGNKIEFQHKDFGKEFTGSFVYSIEGSKLTLSSSTGGAAIRQAEGIYTKQ
jgi:predicted small secreted protein